MVAPSVEEYLARAEAVILPASASPPRLAQPPQGRLYVGVDLGTAYTVLVVLDEHYQPLAGIYQFAQVVRDGLVVDFIGAADLLRGMKRRLEERLGRELTHAASGYPPGVPQAEVRATANVVEAAGFRCVGLTDEPSAANRVLRLERGAIVDVGGGTTGIAVIQDGKVVYTADEPTGGTHFSLVIAGALKISFEEAEKLKTNPAEQERLFPLVRPVMEKVASIAARHVRPFAVERLTLVGGASAFKAMASVVADYTGIPAETPSRPLFVTPLGIAMYNHQEG
jgi:ethanolamine utilization protein EutJ